jgi:hypothetical protein
MIVTSRDSVGRYVTISESPVVTLAEDGVPEREFFRVRGALMYPDGSVAVANAGTLEMRLFGSGGADPVNLGRDGDGPGEFRSLGKVFLIVGDSLAVADSRLLRVTVMDRLGTFSRTVPFMPATVLAQPEDSCIRPELKAILENGDQVYLGWTCIRRDSGGGFIPFEADLVLWKLEAGIATVMDRVPVLEAYAPPGGDPSNFDVAFPPFMKVAAVTARGASVYVTHGSDYEVRKYGGKGELQAVFRLLRPPRAASADLRRAYRATLPAGRQPPAPFPEALPAFDQLMIDDGQRIWAREYPAPGSLAERWAVFDAAGDFLGWTEAPPGVALMSVAGPFVLGVAKDDIGVERPLVFSLSGER